MGLGAIVVSQIKCVLLIRNLLYLVATGRIFAFADNVGGAPLGANRRVVGVAAEHDCHRPSWTEEIRFQCNSRLTFRPSLSDRTLAVNLQHTCHTPYSDRQLSLEVVEFIQVR